MSAEDFEVLRQHMVAEIFAGTLRLKAKNHPVAWPDGFYGELPAWIPVPFTLWDSDVTTILARRGASAIKSDSPRP